MTPWRRSPRSVYQVYGEDDYLAAEDPYAEERSEPSPGGGESVAHGSRSARFVGLGLLVLFIVCAIGLIVAHARQRLPATPRSGVSQSARNAPERYTSAGVPIAGRTVQLSNTPVSGEHSAVPSHPRVPSRPRALPRARAEKLTAPGASVTTTLTPSIAPALTPSIAPAPTPSITPADYEFGFER